MFEQYFDLIFFLLAFFQFFDFVVDFLRRGGEIFFFHLFDFEDFFLFFVFFHFIFLFCVKFFGFSDHFWPAPLLALFLIKPFCA